MVIYKESLHDAGQQNVRIKSCVHSGFGLFSLLLRWGSLFRKNFTKALKMEAFLFSETLVAYNKTTRRHISEDDIGNSYQFCDTIPFSRMEMLVIQREVSDDNGEERT